jgi:hypothetical protein
MCIAFYYFRATLFCGFVMADRFLVLACMRTTCHMRCAWIQILSPFSSIYNVQYASKYMCKLHCVLSYILQICRDQELASSLFNYAPEVWRKLKSISIVIITPKLASNMVVYQIDVFISIYTKLEVFKTPYGWLASGHPNKASHGFIRVSLALNKPTLHSTDEDRWQKFYGMK